MVHPVIPFVYLYANIFPHLGFIENERPEGDGVYLFGERRRNPPNLNFDFAFDDANGPILPNAIGRRVLSSSGSRRSW